MGGVGFGFAFLCGHHIQSRVVLDMIIFGHPVTKRKVFEWILALVATAGVGFLIAFVIINLLLGCETWDESLWTEYNSCFTLQHIIEGVTND